MGILENPLGIIGLLCCAPAAVMSGVFSLGYWIGRNYNIAINRRNVLDVPEV